MSEISPRMGWTYPTADDDPWFDSFVTFVEGVDSSSFAHREDRSVVWAGGGTLSWTLSTETFAWTDTLNVYSPLGGRLLQVAAGSIADWQEGEVVYLSLVRQVLANTTVTLTKALKVPSTDDAMALAVRVGGSIFFRTGISLGDGDSVTGVAPVAGGSSTDVSAIHDNVAGEIAAIAPKATPVALDLMVIEDSENLNVKRSITLSNLPAAAPASHASTHEDGGLDAMDIDAAPSTGSLRTLGTGAQQACAGNDSRLSDSRTPTSHSTSHESGGADSIKLDDLAAPDDNTDLDSSTGAHGLLPKLGGGTTNYLRADGSWAAPPGSPDANAIHVNVAAEISGIAEKTAPVGADLFVIEDSEDSSNKKKVQLFNIPAGRSVSVKDYGAAGDDTADDYSDISDAITAIGSASAVLVFPAGTYYIGTSITFHANTLPLFEKGAKLTDKGDAGVTVTVNSSLGVSAGAYQIFDFTGAGSGVTFANGGEGHPNWWCNAGDGTEASPWTSSFDSAAGLQESHDAGLTLIRAVPGFYRSTAQASWTNSEVSLVGAGRRITRFVIGAAMTYWLSIDSQYHTLRDFTLYGSLAQVFYLGYRKNVVTAGINLEKFDLSTMTRVHFEGVLGSAVRFHRCIRSFVSDIEIAQCGDTGKPPWHFDCGTSGDNDTVQGTHFFGIGLEANYNENVWVSESSGGDAEGAIANTYDGWRFENATWSFCDVTVTAGTPVNGDAVTITGGITATMQVYTTDGTHGDVMQILNASAYTFGAGDVITGPASAWTATIDRVDHQNGQLIRVNDRGTHRYSNFHLNRPGNLTGSYSIEFNFSYYCTYNNFRFSGIHAVGGMHLKNTAYSVLSNLEAKGSPGTTDTVRLLHIENSPEIVVNGVQAQSWFGVLLDGAASDECSIQGAVFNASGDVAASGVIETANTVKGTTLSNCIVHGAAQTGPAFKVAGIRNQLNACRVIDCTSIDWAYQMLSNDIAMDVCQVSNIGGSAVYLDSGERHAVRNCHFTGVAEHGIYMDAGAQLPTIVGNVLEDYAQSGAGFYGIYLDGDAKGQGFVLSSNTLDNNGNTPTNDVFAADGYANCVIADNNFNNATSVRIGSGANKRVYGNTGALENKLITIPDTVVTSGTGEQDLLSVTIPQHSQDVFDVLDIRAAGVKTGGNDTKELKLHLGAEEVIFHPANNDTVDWLLEATIALKDDADHRCMSVGHHTGTTTQYKKFVGDLSAGDLTLKVTGNCANVGDVVSQTMFIVTRE